MVDEGSVAPSQRPSRIARHSHRAEQSDIELRNLRAARAGVHRGERRCSKANHAVRKPWTLRQVRQVVWHAAGLASLLVLVIVAAVELVQALASGALNPVVAAAIVCGGLYVLQAARGA